MTPLILQVYQLIEAGFKATDADMQRATGTACWLPPLVDGRRMQQEGQRILSSHHGARPDSAMRSQACARLNALPEILQDGIEDYIALLTVSLSRLYSLNWVYRSRVAWCIPTNTCLAQTMDRLNSSLPSPVKAIKQNCGH